jgi:hypothetical protein
MSDGRHKLFFDTGVRLATLRWQGVRLSEAVIEAELGAIAGNEAHMKKKVPKIMKSLKRYQHLKMKCGPGGIKRCVTIRVALDQAPLRHLSALNFSGLKVAPRSLCRLGSPIFLTVLLITRSIGSTNCYLGDMLRLAKSVRLSEAHATSNMKGVSDAA